MGEEASLQGGLEPGTTFAGDYRVVRLLAQGGMGAVYVVDQLSTGKARALKVIRPELCDDADLRRRFQQEARIGAKIESEHVIEIHSAGIDEATRSPYLVMELLSGEALDERIRNSGPLSPSATLELFEQLCHAMGAAHDTGIVHRDLKPENVFLAEKKRAGQDKILDVKVLDFGIAKIVEESATRGQTVGMIGTPLWMAPEQTERGAVKPSADVWALGLILYYCMTGHRFWRAAHADDATFTQILKEVVMGPLPAASQRAREQGVAALWPMQLDLVFGLSVARDPAKRYADARLFLNAVRTALTTHETPRPAPNVLAPPSPRSSSPDVVVARQSSVPSATAPTFVPPVSSSFETSPHATNMRPWIWLGVTCAIVVVVIQGFLAVRRGSREREEREAKAQQAQQAQDQRDPRVLPHPREARTSVGVRCRLCTSRAQTTVSGGLTPAAVIATMEAAFPQFDAQCIEARAVRGRGRPRAPSVFTLEFVVKDGTATSRHVASSTSRDGVDECLSRALADVRFGVGVDPTTVSYTLNVDPTADR